MVCAVKRRLFSVCLLESQPRGLRTCFIKLSCRGPRRRPCNLGRDRSGVPRQCSLDVSVLGGLEKDPKLGAMSLHWFKDAGLAVCCGVVGGRLIQKQQGGRTDKAG